jgi:alpha-tubulin suppressor-like RCC1 family protein
MVLPYDDASTLDASSNEIDGGPMAQEEGSALDVTSQPGDGALDGSPRCEPDASCAPCRLRHITTGFASTCGIKLDGTVVCWGTDQWKGNEVAPGQFTQISSGAFHTCGIRPDGMVTCWGSNSYGQLDAPSGQFIQVSGGWTHTCGIRSDRSIACWGNNDGGAASPPAGAFREVAAGFSITCAIRSADSSVACWGAGLASPSVRPSSPFVHIRAWQTACALTSDGTAFCWSGTPTEPIVRHDGPFLDVSVAPGYACGLKSDGSIACWGNSFFGQTSPPSGLFTGLSVGELHGCALHADGTVACWGSDDSGERDVPYCQENPVDGGPDEPGAPTEDAARDAVSEDRTEAPGGVIDQSNRIEYGGIGLQPDQYPGQSFTVGHSGTLVGIGVPMFRYDSQVGATERVTLRLFRCSTTEVCESVPLATATLALDAVSTTYPSPVIPQSGESGYFDLSAAALQVKAGEIYFFLLSPPLARDLAVLSSPHDPYPGGVEFIGSPYSSDVRAFPSDDLVFGIYVAAP